MALYVIASICVSYDQMPGCCGCCKMTDDISDMSAEMCKIGFKLQMGSQCEEIMISFEECNVILGMKRVLNVLRKTLLRNPIQRLVPFAFIDLYTPKFEDLFVNSDPAAFSVKRVQHTTIYPINHAQKDMFDMIVLKETLGETSRGIIRGLYEVADYVLTTTDAQAPMPKLRLYKWIRSTVDSDDDHQPEPKPKP